MNQEMSCIIGKYFPRNSAHASSEAPSKPFAASAKAEAPNQTA